MLLSVTGQRVPASLLVLIGGRVYHVGPFFALAYGQTALDTLNGHAVGGFPGKGGRVGSADQVLGREDRVVQFCRLHAVYVYRCPGNGAVVQSVSQIPFIYDGARLVLISSAVGFMRESSLAEIMSLVSGVRGL